MRGLEEVQSLHISTLPFIVSRHSVRKKVFDEGALY